MGLQTPEIIDYTGRPLLSTEVDETYRDPARSGELELHASFGILVVFPLPTTDENGNPIVPRVKLDVLSEPVKTRYIILRDLLGACVANAESIVGKLKAPNADIYKQSSDYKEGENVYEIVSLYDFMKLKNKFLDFVKENDEYKHLAVYGRKAGKPLRREFDLFIIYRNIFTHGKLRIMMPDYTFCIEFIDNNSKKTVYMLINESVINNFNQTYNAFNVVLNAYRKGSA